MAGEPLPKDHMGPSIKGGSPPQSQYNLSTYVQSTRSFGGPIPPAPKKAVKVKSPSGPSHLQRILSASNRRQVK